MTKARGHSRRLLSPVATTIFMSTVAALCFFSGLDRLTVERDRIKGPVLFGGAASGIVASIDARSGNDAAAIDSAKLFVRTDPIDPAATSVLGSTLLRAGYAEKADQALRVAAQLGWRQIPVQLYWLAVALSADDIQTAKQRLDALMRLRVQDPAITDAIDKLEATPEGERALASLLVENPPWTDRFLARIGMLSPANVEIRQNTIVLAKENGATLNCSVLARAVTRLIRRGYTKRANNMWQQTCGAGTSDAIQDGDFEQPPNAPTPFTWNFVKHPGIDAAIVNAPSHLHGHALRITSSLSVRKRPVFQLLFLSPGSYRIVWQSWRANGSPDLSLSPRLKCNQSRDELLGEEKTIQTHGLSSSVAVKIPKGGCSTQTLSIEKQASGFGQNETGWIDNITITPTSRVSKAGQAQ